VISVSWGSKLGQPQQYVSPSLQQVYLNPQLFCVFLLVFSPLPSSLALDSLVGNLPVRIDHFIVLKSLTTCAVSSPSGPLKVSVGTHFGIHYLLPLLDEFLGRYPLIRPDWEFDNRKIDLIGERFDAAIGGGFELPQGIVARELAPAHTVLAASPAYLASKPAFVEPEDLAFGEGIRIRSPQTGRVRNFILRDSQDRQAAISLPERMTFNEPEACCEAAVMGLGIVVASLPNLLPYLESGRLVRVLPNWYAENGSLSLYFPTHKMLPAKTRVFVDFVIEKFREQQLSRRFDARIMFVN